MDSIGVHQAGRLQIEALGFEETKGRFDGPPLAIQRDDLVQIGAIGYQEDAFAFGRSVTDQMQRQVLIQADVFIDLGRVTPLMAAAGTPTWIAPSHSVIPPAYPVLHCK